MSAPFEETISEESEDDDPTDLQELIASSMFEQNVVFVKSTVYDKTKN